MVRSVSALGSSRKFLKGKATLPQTFQYAQPTHDFKKTLLRPHFNVLKSYQRPGNVFEISALFIKSKFFVRLQRTWLYTYFHRPFLKFLTYSLWKCKLFHLLHCGKHFRQTCRYNWMWIDWFFKNNPINNHILFIDKVLWC